MKLGSDFNIGISKRKCLDDERPNRWQNNYKISTWYHLFYLGDHLWWCSLNKMQTRNDSDRKNLNERDYGEKIKNCGWKGGTLLSDQLQLMNKKNIISFVLFYSAWSIFVIFYNIILLPYESYESFKFFKEENKINFKIKQKQFSKMLLDMTHNFRSYFWFRNR